MYKDLLAQITKYLKPREEYYFLLEIEKDNSSNNIVFFHHFNLIYKLNDEIKMMYLINSFASKNKFFIKNITIDDYLILGFDYWHSLGEDEFPHTFILISFKEMKLMIIKNSNLFRFTEKKEIPELIKLIGKDGRYLKRGFASENKIDIFKINKKSIKSIKKSIKTLQRFSGTLTYNICENNFTEEDKIYLKIYDINL